MNREQQLAHARQQADHHEDAALRAFLAGDYDTALHHCMQCERYSAIRRRHDQGESIERIAEELGISVRAVRKALIRQATPTPDPAPGAPAGERDDQ